MTSPYQVTVAKGEGIKEEGGRICHTGGGRIQRNETKMIIPSIFFIASLP